MISVQKCQFLAISEDWTNVYACFSFKLIVKNECLVSIHSLDFALLIYVTKIRKFHVSQFWNGTGTISLFVVLALCPLFLEKMKMWKVYRHTEGRRTTGDKKNSLDLLIKYRSMSFNYIFFDYSVSRVRVVWSLFAFTHKCFPGISKRIRNGRFSKSLICTKFIY